MAGGDISSLYVSMYKRDYYMHQETADTGDQVPVPGIRYISEKGRVKRDSKTIGGENKSSEVRRVRGSGDINGGVISCENRELSFIRSPDAVTFSVSDGKNTSRAKLALTRGSR